MIEHHTDIELRNPVLVAAFRGWNEAGEAATTAAAHLVRAWGAKKIASIDPEDFLVVNLEVIGISVLPTEDDPPLIVDPDAVLPSKLPL